MDEATDLTSIRPNIAVFVPRANTVASMTIPRGSAIVADPPLDATSDSFVVAFFETRERHSDNRTQLATLVNIAAGRCHWQLAADGSWSHYPIQSKAPLRFGDLIRVGEFDDRLGELRLDDAEAERHLVGWTGELHLP